MRRQRSGGGGPRRADPARGSWGHEQNQATETKTCLIAYPSPQDSLVVLLLLLIVLLIVVLLLLVRHLGGQPDSRGFVQARPRRVVGEEMLKKTLHLCCRLNGPLEWRAEARLTFITCLPSIVIFGASTHSGRGATVLAGNPPSIWSSEAAAL